MNDNITSPLPAWTRCRLKHVARVAGASSASQSDTVDDGPVAYVSPSELSGTALKARTSRWLSAEAGARFEIVPAGSVYVCTIASVGKFVQLAVPGVTNPQVRALVASPLIRPRFLTYLVAALQDEITRAANSSVVPFIAPSDLGEVELIRPPLATQDLISNYLDAKIRQLDELIAKKERIVALLQEKRRAIITQAVTGGLDGAPPSLSVALFTRVPAHWSVLPLRRVVRRFIDYRGRTPTKTADGVRLITAGAIRDGRIDHARAPEYMSPEEFEAFMERGRPEVGDVVFTTEAPLGEVAQVEDIDVAFAQRVILFKVDRMRMNPAFLSLYYQSSAGRADVTSRASGSTAEGIRADRLRASLVPVPPLEEQARIVDFVRAHVARLEAPWAALSASIAKLREYRQALITAAVTGQLDVTKEHAA